MRRRTVTVNDKMQRGYRYVLSAAPGRNFDVQFKPQLTPAQMLRLGVFGGKYMTDCRREFPKSWFADAKLSPRKADPACNFFGVDASQPLSEWKRKGWIHPDDTARLVPVVLPLLHGPAHAGGRPPANRAVESDPAPRAANREALRAGRPALPAATAAGAAALGLRQPQDLTPYSAATAGVRAGRRLHRAMTASTTVTARPAASICQPGLMPASKSKIVPRTRIGET